MSSHLTPAYLHDGTRHPIDNFDIRSCAKIDAADTMNRSGMIQNQTGDAKMKPVATAIRALFATLFRLGMTCARFMGDQYHARPRLTIFNGLFLILCLAFLIFAIFQDDGIISEVKESSRAVVILDIGHGGKDPGAVVSHAPGADGRDNRLIEHALVLDIGGRVARLLELEPEISLQPILVDSRQGLPVTDSFTPTPSRDPVIKTTPPCNLNENWGSFTVNLRWLLANDIARRWRVTRGGTERLMIFISLHMDRVARAHDGLTVFVPTGPARAPDDLEGKGYEAYEQGRRHFADPPRFEDGVEAVDRSFELGRLIVDAFKDDGLAVSRSKPIRNWVMAKQIFSPAVLKFNTVEARVLLELANLASVRDQAAIIEPEYREAMAGAIVKGIKEYIAENSDL